MNNRFPIQFTRRLAISVFCASWANFILHAFGFFVFDFTELLSKSPLAVSELLLFLASTSNYAHILPEFAEFVLVQLGLIVACFLVLLILILRRFERLIGNDKSSVIENKSLLFAVLFFFWIGLHPYVRAWPTGNENDNLLIISLYLQMFIQSTLWAIVTLLAIGCLIVPERMNEVSNKSNASK